MSNEMAELEAWASAIAAEPVRLERAVVRREGWIAKAKDRSWFLRVGREADPANPPKGVIEEGKLAAILAGAGVKAPAALGIHPTGAVLYEWVNGSAAVVAQPKERHDELLGQYMDQLAVLHTIDVEKAGVDWMHRPATAQESALAFAEAVWNQMGHLAVEPLGTFGMEWLRWHVPASMERLSILHGDAGTGNYMVDASGLTGVIDWEWAHLGDPMEDLGSAVMHASFHPVGDLRTALARYAKASGLTVDIDKVRYYAAHLYVRSVVALAAHVSHLDPHNPVALNLAYKIVNDRLTCEAIADALGVTLTKPALPAARKHGTTLYDVIVANLDDDVVPACVTPFAKDRAANAARLAGVLSMQARYGDEIAAAHCDDFSALLGHRVSDVDDGLRQLCERIPQWGQAREVEVLQVLYNRAVRDEWLAGPVTSMFPGIQIGAL